MVLLYHSVEDRLIWHYSKDGIYNVKSGYRLAFMVNHVFSQLHSEVGWKKLW